MTVIPRYAAIGKINDGEEKGKVVFVIGDSATTMATYAKKHGVYDLELADEVSGSMIVTYTGAGTGLRIWPNFREGERVP